MNEADVAAALEQLKLEYTEQGRAFQLLEKAEGWQIGSDPRFAQLGSAVVSCGQTDAVDSAGPRDACDYRLSPADYPSGC